MGIFKSYDSACSRMDEDLEYFGDIEEICNRCFSDGQRLRFLNREIASYYSVILAGEGFSSDLERISYLQWKKSFILGRSFSLDGLSPN